MDTLEALRTLLDAQSYADAMVARLFIAGPDDGCLVRLAGVGLRESVALLDDDEDTLSRLLAGAAKTADELGCDGATGEFENAFYGIGSKIHPYESVFRSDENLLYQLCTLEVRATYRELGFEVPQHTQFPDDSFALEFEFMHKACEKAATALASGDVELCQLAVRMLQRFIQQHVGTWAGPFAQSFERTRYEGGLYHQLACFGAALVAQQAVVTEQVSSELDKGLQA